MTDTPIQKAAAIAGGQSLLAKAIEVRPALVWQWVNGRRPVAGRHCLSIEAATEGAVTRYELRPDIFGAVPTEQKAA